MFYGNMLNIVFLRLSKLLPKMMEYILGGAHNTHSDIFFYAKKVVCMVKLGLLLKESHVKKMQILQFSCEESFP